MRKYIDIYRDFCDWWAETTGKEEYRYDNFIKDRDIYTAKSFLYKTILEMCYDKKHGSYYFCKFIIGDLMDIGFPSPFRFNNLLNKWDKLVKNYKKLCILSGRGSGKSLWFSGILNIYDMFLFKHRRVIMISASQEQANHLLTEIKSIIEHNEWLVNKKNEQKWAAEMIYYNDGYILVKGIGSEILGQHVDRIVVDDILSQKEDRKITDEEVEDFIDMTLDPMLLNRKGQMIIVGTPKRETDIFTTIFDRVKEGAIWKIDKFPAIIKYETKELQCPDRFTWSDIMDKRLSMGPLKFAREYQLEVFSREASLFPKKIIDPAKDKGKDISLIFKDDGRDPNWSFVFAVDVARSGSVSADYTVMIGLAHNAISQEKHLIFFWRSKGLKISEQAKQIAEVSKAFNHPYILVEQNNMGQDMIDELVDNYNVNVDKFVTGGKGQKKDELIRFLITAFEHEKIIIPRGDEYSRKRMDILESELAKFCVSITPAGNEKFEGKGSHDDTVIALALANRASQTVGVPFAVTYDQDGKMTGGHVYGTLLQIAKGESDLEKMIRMGIIK